MVINGGGGRTTTPSVELAPSRRRLIVPVGLRGWSGDRAETHKYHKGASAEFFVRYGLVVQNSVCDKTLPVVENAISVL